MLVGFVMYRVDGVSFPFNDGVETVMLIRFVFHNSDGTVRFVKRIFSNYFVSNTFFLLLVDVMMFRVVYSVLVLVMRYSLHKIERQKFLWKFENGNLRGSQCLCSVHHLR